REARQALEYAAANDPDRSQFPVALARLLAAAPDDEVRDGARAVALVRLLLEQRATVAVRETMAMALAETRQYDEAVMWQRDAINAGAGRLQPSAIARMRDTLALYQQKRPCRTPWRSDFSWDDLRARGQLGRTGGKGRMGRMVRTQRVQCPPLPILHIAPVLP